MKTIRELCALSRGAVDDHFGKQRFKKSAVAFLKHLAYELALDPSDYSIRWNPGAQAVTGDATLHHERLYVTIGDEIGGMLGLARRCNGRKDYAGGVNNPILSHHDLDHVLLVCRQILRVQEGQ